MPDPNNPTNGNPMTIDDLAEIIQRTMATKEDVQHLEQRIGGIERQMATKDDLVRLERKMDESFQAANSRLDLIHHDTADLPAIREELDNLRTRVARLEAKLGLAA
ncbi:MAG: hypothetical protein Q8R13_04720 [bacterium]|nr:hypothetical protein [bacterium]MDZ4295815.1 hypothetical protein [Patescibacteria group bacterium]